MPSSHQHAAARELHNVIIDPDLKRVENMQKPLQCSVQNFTYNGAQFITAGNRPDVYFLLCLLIVIYCDTAINFVISDCIQFQTGAKFHTVIIMASLWENVY
jgi:hypothetical protein